MKFSEGMMTAKKAGELVSRGYMCSQCVFAHFAPELGLSEELALQLSGAFGGGSFYGGTCGAVVGANLALSMEYGWSEDPTREQIQKLEEKVKEFNTCREILGKSFASAEETAEIYAQNLMDRCPAVISSACDILSEILEEE